MSSSENFIEAVKNGKLEEAKSLLPQVENINAAYGNEMTALHFAAEKGYTEIVELLLEHKADVNAKNTFGETPLYMAAEKGHTEIVKLLLEHKADVNVKNILSEILLYMVAEKGHTEIVELLLEYGADVNVKSILSETPLHMAAKKGHTEIVKLLLEHKADVNAQDRDGKTPLHMAAKKGYTGIVELPFTLLVYGAELNDDDREKINDTPELKNCLTAFKKIKAMPHLGKLVGTNIKKENAKVIRKYINNEANQKALIAEFKTISEKYGSDKQLAFIPRCLLNAAKHVNLAFLRSYIDKNTMASCLHESKNDISIIKKKGSETEVISKMLPICASKKIVSYLNNDTYKNVLLALSKRTDEFLIELEETVHRPKSALTKAQSEATSSRSKCL